MGPVTLLMAALVITNLIYYFRWDKKTDLKYILLISLPVVSSLLVVVYSGARNAYLGFIMIVTVYFVYFIRNYKAIIQLSLFTIGFIIIVMNIDIVQTRVIAAKQQVYAYFQAEDNQISQETAQSSAGIRLEMWRASWYLVKASPVFGVGRGNYNQSMQKYIDAGLVNPAVNDHSHPHNAFVEIIVSRGILGLSIMLFLLYYPFYLFYKYRIKSRVTALMGMTHIILISIFSVTDASTFIKGNYVAVNLVFLSILLAQHLRIVKKAV